MSSEPVYRTRPGGHQIQPASQPEATKINDFIYLSEGLSNAFLITTSEGRIVINTGMGFEAPVHKRNYDAVDSGPIRYILLTQGHVDHVGGTAAAEDLAHRAVFTVLVAGLGEGPGNDLLMIGLDVLGWFQPGIQFRWVRIRRKLGS